MYLTVNNTAYESFNPFNWNGNCVSVLIVLKAWSRRALLPPAAPHTEDATPLAGNPDST